MSLPPQLPRISKWMRERLQRKMINDIYCNKSTCFLLLFTTSHFSSTANNSSDQGGISVIFTDEPSLSEEPSPNPEPSSFSLKSFLFSRTTFVSGEKVSIALFCRLNVCYYPCTHASFPSQRSLSCRHFALPYEKFKVYEMPIVCDCSLSSLRHKNSKKVE